MDATPTLNPTTNQSLNNDDQAKQERKQSNRRSQDSSDACYDYPQYWDFAFSEETELEADFIEAAADQYCLTPGRRMFEPGCGGGRLVIEMAKRGYEVDALDLSEPCVQYVNQLIAQQQLTAQVEHGDMTDFSLSQPIDVAFNTMNTFRHLTTEEAARSHLSCIANQLNVGGIYILGLHLLPPDASLEDGERWVVKKDDLKVTMTLRVLDASRETRLENLRFCLRVRDGEKDLKLRSDYTLRVYDAEQIMNTLDSVPQFEICGIYDFWYDLEDPVTLTDENADTVFILRRTH